jgi:K+-transporting ATPase A subunit
VFLKLAEITWYCRTMTMYYIYTSYPCNKCILLSQRIMSVKWYMYEAIFVLVGHYNPVLPDFEIINYLFNYRYGSRSDSTISMCYLFLHCLVFSKFLYICYLNFLYILILFWGPSGRLALAGLCSWNKNHLFIYL